MRGSRAFRLFSALFAPWFALVVAEPVPMHDCPMHSMHPAAMHGMQGGAAASAGSRDGVAESPAVMEHVGTGSDSGTDHHSQHKQCCCLGACCATVAMVLGTGPRAAWAQGEVRHVVPPVPVRLVAVAATEHVLPFANGPPSVLA